MTRKLALLGGAAVASALFITAATSQGPEIDVPVMITPGNQGDACATGEIVGLDPNGDGFL